MEIWKVFPKVQSKNDIGDDVDNEEIELMNS